MMKQRLIDQVIDATGGEWPSNAFRCRAQKTFITRDEFEARKAERQKKPGWDDAPAWANYMAQTDFGGWFFYRENPTPSEASPAFIGGWATGQTFTSSREAGEVIGDWRNTLEQRPSQIHQTGDLGRSSGTVGANHIGEAARVVSDVAVVSPRLAISLARRLLPELFDNSPSLGEPADWYDYEKQKALRLPPVGVECEVYGPVYQRSVKQWAKVKVYAHIDSEGLSESTTHAREFKLYTADSYRPLDWNPKVEPEPEPELSFHLSNAFNELQASAHLLPEDDPRRAQLVALAGGVSAVREVA
jgi:hypothetical protein